MVDLSFLNPFSSSEESPDITQEAQRRQAERQASKQASDEQSLNVLKDLMRTRNIAEGSPQWNAILNNQKVGGVSLQDEFVKRELQRGLGSRTPRQRQSKRSPQDVETLKMRALQLGFDPAGFTPDDIASEIKFRLRQKQRPKRATREPRFKPRTPEQSEALRSRATEAGIDIRGLTDQEIAGIVKGRVNRKLRTQEKGTKKFRGRRKRGIPQLTIERNKAFERSGLKTGDVVCVRIGG